MYLEFKYLEIREPVPIMVSVKWNTCRDYGLKLTLISSYQKWT